MAVWNALTHDLNLKRSWMGVTLVECMKNWTKDKSVPSYLAVYAMWYIWQERNKTLFEDIKPSVKTVLYKILAHPLCKTTYPKDKIPKDIMIGVDLNTTLAWFDGAAKSDGSMCGAGGIIKVQKAIVYKWKLNCGKGTDTKAELMGAWASLWIAEFLKLLDLHLLGDSKVVIDWLKKEGSLQVGILEGWKARIIKLSGRFHKLAFQHIYRTFNMEADSLSKHALEVNEGFLHLQKWSNGAASPERLFRIH
jgi:ribonuclease HI